MQETKPTEKRGALRKFTKSPLRINMVLPTLSLSRERELVQQAKTCYNTQKARRAVPRQFFSRSRSFMTTSCSLFRSSLMPRCRTWSTRG